MGETHAVGLTEAQFWTAAGIIFAALLSIVVFFVRRFIVSIDAQKTAFERVQANNDKNFKDIQTEISSLAGKVSWILGTMHTKEPEAP